MLHVLNSAFACVGRNHRYAVMFLLAWLELCSVTNCSTQLLPVVFTSVRSQSWLISQCLAIGLFLSLRKEAYSSSEVSLQVILSRPCF